MKEIFDRLPEEAAVKVRRKEQPEWTAPMLATLTHETFSRDDWIFERKLDGVRCLAFKKGDEVRLMSRNRKEMNVQYPEIREVIAAQDSDFIVDGEIVAFEGNTTSFSKLQPRMHSRKPDLEVEVFFYLFDILHLDGHDLSRLGLRHRKSLLKTALTFQHDNLRYTVHRNRDGEGFLEEAREKGWEGLIAKDANSHYMHRRSKKWLKFKVENQQELIICGYTEPGGLRKHFGALIVGYYEQRKLRHAGKVGTGFDRETLETVMEKMKALERKTPPFKRDPGYRNAHWLKPELVGEFRFTEWTADNRLRHPSFLGLRYDKKPEEVVQEK